MSTLLDSLSTTETHIVVFRKADGLICAVFPFVPATVTNADNEICIYSSLFGFGASNYENLIAFSSPATPEEYETTQEDLMSRGFTLQPYDHDALFGKYSARCKECFYPSLACHCGAH